MKFYYKLLIILMVSCPALFANEHVLVEAESFKTFGGWKIDTQFIEIMGSPYLLAHGLGKPVDDAVTKVMFKSTGKYRLWVRTKDWVAHWKAPGAPGKFQLIIDGKSTDTTFGTTGAEWHWQDGGTVDIKSTEIELKLRDLTGFDGRCDAILFTKDPNFKPDNSSEILPKWRREMLGVNPQPTEQKFDLVVVGGGYAGMGAAVAASRMGLKVCLLQNRPVLGGNGSAEVRVWAKGNIPPGLYPMGDIIAELSDHAKKSPGTYEEFGDAKKERILKAEKNLTMLLNHHAYKVLMKDKSTIQSVYALDTMTNEIKAFTAPLFVDSTGHGYIAMKAGAEGKMEAKGRMGMSNMWAWKNEATPQSFPKTPWALKQTEKSFPYPNKYHAQWFWESGYDKHPLNDLELIRDWNLRASYGAWNAIKNEGVYKLYDKANGHRNARMTWLAYIGGTRETQQFFGDIILSKKDIQSGREFDDACVLSTWSIDLHYPKKQYLAAYPDNPFISYAVHGKGVDRKKGYPVPYRCFYSRNINNLFLAGRMISVTHEALGTVRVMKTLGMTGVAVGKAAAVATKHSCNPREVYKSHLSELKELWKLSGKTRRESLNAPFTDKQIVNYDKGVYPLRKIPNNDITKLKGIVLDDKDAVKTGQWNRSNSHPEHFGPVYLYSSSKGGEKTITWKLNLPNAGKYHVRLSYTASDSRDKAVPVEINTANGVVTVKMNQQKKQEFKSGLTTVGTFEFKAGETWVKMSTKGTTGHVIADLVQLEEVK